LHARWAFQTACKQECRSECSCRQQVCGAGASDTFWPSATVHCLITVMHSHRRPSHGSTHSVDGVGCAQVTISCHDCQHQHVKWLCPNPAHKVSKKSMYWSYCNRCVPVLIHKKSTAYTLDASCCAHSSTYVMWCPQPCWGGHACMPKRL
jgi:hypothetical protein